MSEVLESSDQIDVWELVKQRGTLIEAAARGDQEALDEFNRLGSQIAQMSIPRINAFLEGETSSQS